MEAGAWNLDTHRLSTSAKRSFSPDIFYGDPETKRLCLEPHKPVAYSSLITPSSSDLPWSYQAQILPPVQTLCANSPSCDSGTDRIAFPQAPAFSESVYPSLTPSSVNDTVSSEGSQNDVYTQSLTTWSSESGLPMANLLENRLDIGYQLKEVPDHVNEAAWSYNDQSSSIFGSNAACETLSSWERSTRLESSPPANSADELMVAEEQTYPDILESGTPSPIIPISECITEPEISDEESFIQHPDAVVDTIADYDSCFGVVCDEPQK